MVVLSKMGLVKISGRDSAPVLISLSMIFFAPQPIAQKTSLNRSRTKKSLAAFSGLFLYRSFSALLWSCAPPQYLMTAR
jgi:hypothetical protein